MVNAAQRITHADMCIYYERTGYHSVYNVIQCFLCINSFTSITLHVHGGFLSKYPLSAMYYGYRVDQSGNIQHVLAVDQICNRDVEKMYTVYPLFKLPHLVPSTAHLSFQRIIPVMAALSCSPCKR